MFLLIHRNFEYQAFALVICIYIERNMYEICFIYVY